MLAAHGIGNDDFLRWELPYVRALAHYHGIMLSLGNVCDWQDVRQSRAERKQARLHRRATAYLESLRH